MNRLIPSSIASFAAAVLLAHSTLTHAGEPTGDARSQAASVLLALSSNRTSDPDTAIALRSARTSDAQEQARDFLLGHVTFDPAGLGTAVLGVRSPAIPAILSTRIHRADADAQERARALVLSRGV
ncbi:MAG TPA: hypothetical protein VGL55_11780 [Steroidobacteraceae bacterium]